MAFTTRQAASEQKSAQEAAAKPSAQLFSDQRASTSVQLKQQQLMQTAQLAAEEEEPLQGKFEAAQLAAEEEEPLQGKFATAQLAGMEEEVPMQGKFATAQLAALEEEPLQGKFVAQRAEEEEPLQGKFESPAPAQREQKPNNTGMPDNLKSGIENLSGYSMDDVKVHYNSDRPAQLNAHAYAQGTDIHVAPGQEQHLPHEAWHVVQQKQGRVQATMQMKAGVPVNDDAGLENEADVMGAKALIQRKKVLDDHVRDDLLHDESAKLFSRATINFFDGKLVGTADQKEKVVSDNRDQVSYQQLSDSKLVNGKGLESWLSGSGEHMYVHHKSAVHIATRTDNKLPHPTLVGGDPDVKGAGTMYKTGKDVFITRQSGHFRPSSVSDSTVTFVENIYSGKGKRVLKDESL